MLRTNAVDMIDRAMGALLGGALGDALGMPTQTFSADLIAATYGWVDRFLARMPDHPVSRGLLAGTITDDTEHTFKRSQREVGITTIFVTHDQEEALTMADRIGILREG